MMALPREKKLLHELLQEVKRLPDFVGGRVTPESPDDRPLSDNLVFTVGDFRTIRRLKMLVDERDASGNRIPGEATEE